jgi:hypothetical protein
MAFRRGDSKDDVVAGSRPFDEVFRGRFAWIFAAIALPHRVHFPQLVGVVDMMRPFMYSHD